MNRPDLHFASNKGDGKHFSVRPILVDIMGSDDILKDSPISRDHSFPRHAEF